MILTRGGKFGDVNDSSFFPGLQQKVWRSDFSMLSLTLFYIAIGVLADP